MKRAIFIWVLSIGFPVLLFAQQVDTIKPRTDSITVQADTARKKADSLQTPPTAISAAHLDSARPVFKPGNRLLNTAAAPVSSSVQFRKENGMDFLFYTVAGILLLLAFFKYFYNRYFTNLFRVFFNTSLRQSQLTDQLLQDQFPSLLFNIFFILSGGFYTYLLLVKYNWISENNRWLMMASVIALLGLIYLVKFCTLKFTGWITGLSDVTNTYVFIIFLINKIMGVFLVPFIVILSFSDNVVVRAAVIVSLMSILLFFLLRFFRSYGLLQNQLKISRFHFILYIAGIELLPLLLIYKGLMLYLTKNL